MEQKIIRTGIIGSGFAARFHYNAMQTYAPDEEKFRNIYVVEKTETKQGWSSISPDEGWFNGYQQNARAPKFQLCLSE